MDVRGTRLTYAGLNALAKANAGEELRFTRVVMGDGELPPDTDIRELTEAINIMLNLPILDVKVTGVGTTVIESRLQNATLTQGFFARETGIYAVVNPTEAEKQSGIYENEILYAYRNTANKSEYIPAGGTSEVWDIIYDVITVIDNAENITADVSGDLSYVTRPDFREHIDSENPHPNTPTFKDDIQNVTQATKFWVQSNDDKQLHGMTIEQVKQQVIGTSEWTIPKIVSRLDRVENTQANILMSEELNESYPDLNYGMAEQFKDMDTVDTLSIKVISAVKGDDSIDVESLCGIIIGWEYTLLDSALSQEIKVKACAREAGVNRVILSEPVKEKFDLEDLKLCRTTAEIKDGVVTWGAERYMFKWEPDYTFSGIAAGVPLEQKIEFNSQTYNLCDTYGEVIPHPSGGISLGGVE